MQANKHRNQSKTIIPFGFLLFYYIISLRKGIDLNRVYYHYYYYYNYYYHYNYYYYYYYHYYYDLFIIMFLFFTLGLVYRARGPFLESPGNFSSPKSNIHIEI